MAPPPGLQVDCVCFIVPAHDARCRLGFKPCVLCVLRRLAWVVGYTMGPFGAIERPWKPFNPILGETFEVHKDGGRVRYIAEQVSRF